MGVCEWPGSCNHCYRYPPLNSSTIEGLLIRKRRLLRSCRVVWVIETKTIVWYLTKFNSMGKSDRKKTNLAGPLSSDHPCVWKAFREWCRLVTTAGSMKDEQDNTGSSHWRENLTNGDRGQKVGKESDHWGPKVRITRVTRRGWRTLSQPSRRLGWTEDLG